MDNKIIAVRPVNDMGQDGCEWAAFDPTTGEEIQDLGMTGPGEKLQESQLAEDLKNAGYTFQGGRLWEKE